MYNFFHPHSAFALFTRVSRRRVQAITFPVNPETSATFTNVYTQLARNSQKRSRQQRAFMNKSSRKTAVSHTIISLSRRFAREQRDAAQRNMMYGERDTQISITFHIKRKEISIITRNAIYSSIFFYHF